MFMNLTPDRQQVVLQNPGRLAVAVSGPEINPKLTLAESSSGTMALSIKMLSIKYHYVETISDNRTAHIRYQCRKTTVLSCHRCQISTGVEKNQHHLNRN
jgi:hypothetical protein